MSIKEIKSDILYKEYSLQIPYEEIDDLINNKIKEIIPTVTLPGFRKGKAPINIVKKRVFPINTGLQINKYQLSSRSFWG